MGIWLFSYRCDSLSNLYLWHIKYSAARHLPVIVTVVIRFQICIFDILNTAASTQERQSISCDSLSNLYLWHIKYSYNGETHTLSEVVIRFQICIFDILNTAERPDLIVSGIVVIRFQICIFDILNTATSRKRRRRRKLWFAFKFVSLTAEFNLQMQQNSD